MGFKDTLKKQGGTKLIKQFISSGVFFTAMNQLMVLGKNQKALEILRLSTQYKVKKKLQKKYKNALIQFDKEYDFNLEHTSSDKVWICWFQGIENAPEIVKACYESAKKNLSDKEIVLLTKENLLDYVQFPDFILDKWEKGIITHTHMTDLLRLELLINHGGMWMDATVFCSREEKDIPEYYFNSDLFVYQNLKPGRDGHSHLVSSWLMTAKTNNKILMATRHLCYEYWKKNTKMVDYFLLHDFFSIVLEYYEKEWKEIMPCSNTTPHILLLRLFDKYNDDMYREILAQTPFHKLSYKFDLDKQEIDNTYYQRILSGN